MNAGKIVQFDALGKNIQELIRVAIDTREYSHSPYSKFKVGAALICEDGTISKGCNVENAAFPSSICAEQSAIARAVSDGKKKFVAIAVVADRPDVFVAPCGQCRQVIAEFGNIRIYLARPSLGDVLVTSCEELLPHAFVVSDDKKNEGVNFIFSLAD